MADSAPDVIPFIANTSDNVMEAGVDHMLMAVFAITDAIENMDPARFKGKQKLILKRAMGLIRKGPDIPMVKEIGQKLAKQLEKGK
jgi:hypothetical protein